MRILVLLPLLALLAACGDEPLPAAAPPAVTTLQGRLSRAEGPPAAGERLGLFRLDDLRHVGAVTTGADGSFRFAPLAPGSYLPHLREGGGYLVDLPAGGFAIAAEETLRVLLRALFPPPPQRSVEGMVVDAASGAPVEGAVVEVGTLRPTPPEIEGRLPASRAVTDAQGRFALADLLLFPDPGDPENPRTADLLVHAPGYRGLRRGGFAAVDLPARNLRLALAPGADEAVLTGRVVDLALGPREGVVVGLEWVSRPEFLLKQRVVLQQKVAVSDAAGFFRLEGLPSGLHHLAVGYLRDDGWLRVVPDGLPPEAPPLDRPTVSLAAGESLHVAALPAVEAVRPLAPAEGAVASSQPDFAWQEWRWRGGPWAASWLLVLAPLGETDPEARLYAYPLDEPALAWPDAEMHLPPGRHFWRVEAWDGWAHRLPLMETWASFTVVESPVDSLVPAPAAPSSFRCNPPGGPRVLAADGS